MEDKRRRKLLNRMEAEYQVLKTEFLHNGSMEELWESCGKVYFYTMVRDYFDSAGRIPEAYLGLLLRRRQPLSALWEIYSDSESLSFLSWEGIEEIMEVMLQEERESAA